MGIELHNYHGTIHSHLRSGIRRYLQLHLVRNFHMSGKVYYQLRFGQIGMFGTQSMIIDFLILALSSYMFILLYSIIHPICHQLCFLKVDHLGMIGNQDQTSSNCNYLVDFHIT
jgi:hypothetical protein